MPQHQDVFQPLLENDFDRLKKQNWIDREILELNKVNRITSEVGAKLLGKNTDQPFPQIKSENGKVIKTTFTNSFSGLCFPNLLPSEEKPRSFWILRDNPDFVEIEGEPKKVINPIATPANQSNLFFFPKRATTEQLTGNDPIVITVGLLSTLALKRLLNPDYLSKSLITNLNENTLVIGLSNEWAWRNKKDEYGNKLEKPEIIADFDLIKWENRTVYLLFNSNVKTEEIAKTGREKLKQELEKRKANVQTIDLPDVTGVDSIDQLLAKPDWDAGNVLDLFNNSASQEKNAPNAQGKKFDFYSIKDVLDFPDPEMLLGDILPENAFAVIYGQSGVGKSFLSLHLAFCVAFNKQDLFSVKNGHVFYISAEGRAGIKNRTKSWLQSFCANFGIDESNSSNFHYIFSPLNAMDNLEVLQFLSQIKEICPTPKLIVIDTFARSMSGDENSSRDVGAFIKGCDLLKEATNATILLVHHTAKNSNAERGSSALRGASDTMILVEAKETTNKTFLTVNCEKQKDLAKFETLNYELTAYGNSCVLIPTEYKHFDKKSQAENRKKEYLNLLLTDDPDVKGLKWSEVSKLLALTKSSMNDLTKRLNDTGLIRRDNKLIYLTDKGRNWLTKEEKSSANNTNT